jgi:hypothetical protein
MWLLRKIYGWKRNKVTVDWRRLHTEDFQYLYCSPSTFFLCKTPQWAMAPSFTRFLDHKQRHTTVGRTPLDE